MFQIIVNCEKIVDSWGKEGATGKGRTVDAWSVVRGAPEITPETVRSAIKDALERYSVDLKDVSAREESQEFSACRVENNDGEADENGTFLADYLLYVEILKREDYPLTIDLGFPKEG